MNNQVDVRCYANEGLTRLATWRNTGRETGQSFASYLGNSIATEVGLAVLLVVATVEAVVYTVFTALSVVFYAFTQRPLHYFIQATRNSFVTMAICFANMFIQPFPRDLIVPTRATPGTVVGGDPVNEVHVTIEEPLAEVSESLSVNRGKLTAAPAPIDMERLRYVARHIQPAVHVQELLTQFDKILNGLYSSGDFCDDDHGRKLSKREARDKIEQRYITDMQPTPGDTNYHAMIKSDVDLFLKNIIVEFRNSEITSEEKIEALKRLAGAAGHCPPRRHAEALKVWRTLTNQIETLDDIVLQYVQQAKEDLFLDYYSLSSEPVQTLNYIRSIVGTELGLDTSPVNLQDMYITLNDARSPDNRTEKHRTREQFLEVFTRVYKPHAILTLIKSYLNQRIKRDNEFCTQLSAYIDGEIRQHVKLGHVTENYTENLPAPYQNEDDYMLTDVGVRFLLVHFGILNHSETNGHLVAVEVEATPEGAPAA